MKKILLVLLITLSDLLYSQSDIIMLPIKNVNLYSNYNGRFLYPFANSLEIITLSEKDSLKVIEEYEPENELYNDVLEVEVTGGFYKGKTGFVEERFLRLSVDTIKKGVEIYYKSDLPGRSGKYKILGTILNIDEEVYELEDKGEAFRLSDKNFIRFIITKSSEISFYKSKGYDILRLTDPKTLLPIVTKQSETEVTDDIGILYRKKSDKYYVQIKNYTKGLISHITENENMLLCFMEELDSKKLDKNVNEIKDGNLSLTLSTNKINDIVFNYKILNGNALFCLPYSIIFGKKILGAFYLDNIPDNTEIIAFTTYKDHIVNALYFDESEWNYKNLKIDYYNDKVYITIKKSGYYVFTTEVVNSSKSVSFQYNNDPGRLFIIDKDKNFISELMSDKKLLLPDLDVEVISFSNNNPFDLVVTSISKKQMDLSLKQTVKKYPDNFFNKYYNGKWNLYGVKKNDKINNEKNKLESLGDLTIDGSEIIFDINGTRLIGKYEIIDKNKMFINIIYCNKQIYCEDSGKYLDISSSLYDSKIIIPVLYDYYSNTLELSFNALIPDRKIEKSENKSKGKVVMESPYLNFIKYPDAIDKSIYRLYFYKQ